MEGWDHGYRACARAEQLRQSVRPENNLGAWREVVGSDDPHEIRRMLDEAHATRTWVPSEVWLRENGYVKIAPSAAEVSAKARGKPL